MPSQTSCRIYILDQMAFSQTFFVSASRTWRFCKKAVNAEAGSERFDAFIDAGFADIVCRRHQLREWDHLDLDCEFLSVGEAATAGLDGRIVSDCAPRPFHLGIVCTSRMTFESPTVSFLQ